MGSTIEFSRILWEDLGRSPCSLRLGDALPITIYPPSSLLRQRKIKTVLSPLSESTLIREILRSIDSLLGCSKIQSTGRTFALSDGLSLSWRDGDSSYGLALGPRQSIRSYDLPTITSTPSRPSPPRTTSTFLTWIWKTARSPVRGVGAVPRSNPSTTVLLKTH